MIKPFIIAEVGSNFDQSLVKAKKYIDVAKNCKADAVKFQLFSGKNLYPDNYEIQKIFNSIELNIDWVDELLKYANKKKIRLFFSCFDEFKLKNIIKEYKSYKVAPFYSDQDNIKRREILNEKIL